MYIYDNGERLIRIHIPNRILADVGHLYKDKDKYKQNLMDDLQKYGNKISYKKS